MNELNEFCNMYLHHYFAYKFKVENAKKDHIFNFKSDESFINLTVKIFSLLDRLLATNPSFKPSDKIQFYFMFEKADFQKDCKDLRFEEEDVGRKEIKKIIKRMPQLNREFFQIFIRLVYLYFNSKQYDDGKDQRQKKRRQSLIEECKDAIKTLHIQLKILTMTSDDNSIPLQFMQKIIFQVLDMDPNQKFLEIVEDLIKNFNFSQKKEKRIYEKIQTVRFNISKRKKPTSEIDLQQEQIVIKEPKSNKQKLETNQQNQNTPVKTKTSTKAEFNTLETSQRKQNIINRNQNDPESLQTIKKILIPKKGLLPLNQRTIYCRNKYLVPKKIQPSISDQKTTIGSNKSIKNEDEFKIIDITKSYSRCLQINDFEDDGCLAGATPKPKKKTKIDFSQMGGFDKNGEFVSRLC